MLKMFAESEILVVRNRLIVCSNSDRTLKAQTLELVVLALQIQLRVVAIRRHAGSWCSVAMSGRLRWRSKLEVMVGM